jgi:hypothetical protein
VETQAAAMADPTFPRITVVDNSWDDLCGRWRSTCEEHGEEFDQYAIGAMPVLRDLAADERDGSGVFALRDGDGTYHAILQANSTLLPGYEGKVLRIRHLVASPSYDFGDHTLEEYSRMLARVFAKVVRLSEESMPSPHIKMHLRSPADVQYFGQVGSFLGDSGLFSAVKMSGAWLYLTKSPDLLAMVREETVK